MAATPEQAAALAAIAAAVHETHAQQQRISAAAAILATSLGDAPPPPPTPTYAITASAEQIDEGQALVFTVSTTHVAAGTALPYRLQGAINAADLDGVPLVGTVTIGADGTAMLVVPTVADLATEGDEVIEMVLDLPGVLAHAAATIRDTSIAPPPPPPPPAVGERFVQALDPANTIALKAWFYGTTYDRNARFVSITNDTWPCEFYAANYAGNSLRACSVRDYVLQVASILAPTVWATHATVTVPVGAMGGTITLRASELDDGGYMLRVVPATGTETSIPCAVYIRRAAVAPAQPTMFVQAASHDHLHAWNYTRTAWAKVPAAFTPVTRPLPAREYPVMWETGVPASPAAARNQLFAQDIVVYRPGDCYRTRLSQGAGLGAGVLNAAQLQAYYWSYMVGKYPGQVATLDGPRGVGNAAMVTHLQFGRNGGLYFTDPWSVRHCSPDGTIRTIAGYRQQPPARLDVPVTTESAMACLELVGDWSAIPAARRGFHELWGLAWDARSLVVDETAAEIPNGDVLEKPHIAPGPVAFVPDSQNNRVCKLQFDKASHATPVQVSEFITGLGDPWDVVCVDGVLYVSERTSHRIAAYDATTGALIRVVVSGLPLATMNTSIRRMQRNAGVTLADCRAQPCVAPEGLFHWDGWLYWGSLIQQQVRRVHLVTGAIETVVPNGYVDDGSNFYKIDVSRPGTFGPPGTVWLSTFGAAGYSGRPIAYLPGGAHWDYGNALSGEGPGRVWTGIRYACASAVGPGRLAHASSEEGIWLVSKTQPGDGAWGWSRMQALERMWMEQGWHLTHGPGGWGYYGLPLPWGVSTDIDDYLRACGHVQAPALTAGNQQARRFTDG